MNPSMTQTPSGWSRNGSTGASLATLLAHHAAAAASAARASSTVPWRAGVRPSARRRARQLLAPDDPGRPDGHTEAGRVRRLARPSRCGGHRRVREPRGVRWEELPLAAGCVLRRRGDRRGAARPGRLTRGDRAARITTERPVLDRAMASRRGQRQPDGQALLDELDRAAERSWARPGGRPKVSGPWSLPAQVPAWLQARPPAGQEHWLAARAQLGPEASARSRGA